MALEQVGIELLVKGSQAAIAQLSNVTQNVQKLTKTIGEASKTKLELPAATGSMLSRLPAGLSSITKALNTVSSSTGAAIPGLSSLNSALNLTNLAATAAKNPLLQFAAAVGAAAAAGAAFYALGARGAQVEATARAFGNLAGEAGGATDALNRARAATRGTVSDLELMRLATGALAGTSGQFRNVLLKDFGAIVDGSRRIAQATGQNADLIQEKFISGLRLMSKRRIDDIGVMVDQVKAEEQYAEAIGKSRAALTDSEKQTAFASAAIEELKRSMTEFGEPIAALDALKMPFIALQNILDRLGLAIQPIFSPLVQMVGGVFTAIANAVSYAMPIIYSFSGILGEIIGLFQDVVSFGMSALLPFRFLGSVIPYVVAGISIALDTLKGAISGLRTAFNAIAAPIKKVLDKIGVDLDNFVAKAAGGLATGGGFIMGSFAAGLLRGGTYVVKAVTEIAKIVANFLQGFSPPKEGPLSQIDKGGENVAKAWAEGFQKGMLSPVEDVVRGVNTRLGEIASFDMARVEDRIKQLDLALQPFSDQLSIAKSDFEAMAGYVDPALQAVERQRKEALKAFSAKEITAQEVIALDKQYEMLNRIKSQGQGIVDNAQIQYAIAQSQQAQERALLDIQKKRLSAVEQVAMAEETATKAAAAGAAEKAPKEPAEEKAKAGKGEAAPPAEALGGFEPGEAPDLIDPEAVQRAKEVLTAGFEAGKALSGYDEALGEFNASTAELGVQIGRIASSNPVQKLVNKFTGLPAAIAPIMSKFQNIITIGFNMAASATAPVIRAISNMASTIGEILLSGGNLGIDAIKTAIENLPTAFTTAKDLITGTINILEAQVSTGLSIITNVINGLTGEKGFPSIATVVSTLSETLADPLDAVKTLFSNVFGIDVEGGIGYLINSLSSPEGLLGEQGLFAQAINRIFGANGIVNTSLLGANAYFNRFKSTITRILSGAATLFRDYIYTPISRAVSDIKTTIADLVQSLTDFVSTGVSGALSSLGTALTNSFVAPFVNAVNNILDTIESAINDFIDSVNSTLGLVPGFPNIGHLSLGRVSVPGAQRGALNQTGLTLVGERGAELIAPSKPVNIFPAGLTRSLLDFMASPMALPMMGGSTSNTTNNNTRNVTNNFNNVTPDQSLLIARQMEAFS